MAIVLENSFRPYNGRSVVPLIDRPIDTAFGPQKCAGKVPLLQSAEELSPSSVPALLHRLDGHCPGGQFPVRARDTAEQTAPHSFPEVEPDGYILNLATKSQAFSALEGAADARATLRAGFTSVRDVENEGSDYADVALRDAINEELVEGPRMQVATRAIAALGQYNPFGVSPDLLDFPTGAQTISGVEQARSAVREQIGHGADLIKVYADWRYPTLTVEEMSVVVEEAHKAGRKVAAHATTPEASAMRFRPASILLNTGTVPSDKISKS